MLLYFCLGMLVQIILFLLCFIVKRIHYNRACSKYSRLNRWSLRMEGDKLIIYEMTRDEMEEEERRRKEAKKSRRKPAGRRE